jgi:murein DD-endopeptidase MepM/ murein hydrolase activator NlpD
MVVFSEYSKYIFRLTVILCLVSLVRPVYAKKQAESPAPAEYGIGGGVLNDEGIELIPASLESVILEIEAFSRPHLLLFNFHTVKSGENISELAVYYGLNQDTIISINKITNTRLLQIGKVLKIPNQDGILHTVKNGDTLISLSEKYKADIEVIRTSNELFSEKIRIGSDIFIPGAKLDWINLQEINGDLFMWPINGAITSPYGYRVDPFNSGNRQFHTGIDIRGSAGTPIKAAMAGRVSQIGYDSVLGNFVIISHHSGYRTVYGHMSVIRTRTGVYVATGERIGDVGSTGLSTGPHLHFTVYKNGVLVNPRSLIR